jgi:hypothetical protein
MRFMQFGFFSSIVLAGAFVSAGCSVQGLSSSRVAPGGSRDSLLPQVAQVGNPIRWRIFKPAEGSRYRAIVPDPSGKYMWLTDYGQHALVRMAMDGTTQSYPLQAPSGAFAPGFFAFGRDGGIYIGGCVGTNCGVVGIMSADHSHFTVVHTPSGDGPGVANGFVYGSDNNVWFLEQNHIARITPERKITEYAPPDSFAPLGPNIIVGGDKRIWFDGQTGEYNCPNSYMSSCPFYGVIDPETGSIKTDWLNLGSGSYGTPIAGIDGGMALGATGNIYVLVDEVLLGYAYENFYFDVVTPGGGQSAIQLQWYEVAPSDTALTAGPDGNLWWGTGLSFSGSLAVLNFTTGQHTFESPSHTYGVTLAAGGDGNIWAIDNQSNVLVYIIKTLSVSPKTLTFTKLGQTQTLHATYLGTSADLTARSSKPDVVKLTRTGSLAFAVTSVGAGSTSVIIQDREFNSFAVPVTVSTH